jgi:hypothetical protein
LLGYDIVAHRGYPVYENSNPKINPDQQGASRFFTMFNKYTMELRYPLSLNPSSTIFGLAFFEAANGWYSMKEYNPFKLRRSVGLGMRFYLPMFSQMYRNFDAEQFMLSDELKKKREDQLFNLEKEVRELQKKRFGYEGDLFKERQKIVKPVQDKVYNAIQKMAVNRGYDFVLDKSEGITVIFADPKLDKSEEVLKELGLKS